MIAEERDERRLLLSVDDINDIDESDPLADWLEQCFPKWWSADSCRSASPQLPVRKVSQETGQTVSESRNDHYMFKSHNKKIVFIGQ